MKLIRFHIQNFQSHKDTVLEFESGLNILVGSTNTGKSASLRALRKLIRDDPSGKAFISKWASNMRLELEFTHKGKTFSVVRQLTPSKNLYYLDGDEYGGFGKKIPQEIQDALEMGLVELEAGDVLDLHFSDQHDVPFMVSKGSAGTRSKLLGKIAGLHVLDRAISRINSDIRASNSDCKHIIATRDILQADLDDFPDLWYDKELVVSLKDLLDLSKQKQIRFARLTDVQDELHCCSTTITMLEDATLPEIKVDFKKLRHKIAELTGARKIHTELTKLASEAISVKNNDFDVRLAAYIKEHGTILKDLGMCPTCKKPVEDI